MPALLKLRLFPVSLGVLLSVGGGVLLHSGSHSRRGEIATAAIHHPDNSPGKADRAATKAAPEQPQGSPLARHLGKPEILAEAWEPAVENQETRRRIRIASGADGVAAYRLEEEVSLDGKSSRIRGAVAADRILVAARFREVLAGQGLVFEASEGSSFVRVKVPDARDPQAIPSLIRRLETLGVTELSPDAVIEAAGLSGDPAVGDGEAWHLENRGLVAGSKAGADIDAISGWDHATDASSVTIALLDSGLNQNDPELVDSIRISEGEIAGDGIDNDGNGYIDDSMGYDFRNRDGTPEDQTAHGTGVAAFMAASGNNGKLSSGVAWKASILNCKVLDQNGLGNVSDAVDAIDYAIRKGAKIINLSWTSTTESPLLSAALKRANDAGIIIVCSGGQHYIYERLPLPEPVPHPAALNLPLMVTVAASAWDDTLAPFTLTDPTKIDLAAPGVNLNLRLAGDDWRFPYTSDQVSGTSYSTGMVSAALALAISQGRGETPQQVIQRMLDHVDPIPGGAAALGSGGRLNLGKMLAAAGGRVPHDGFADRRILPDNAGRWTGRNTGAGVDETDARFTLNPAAKRTLWFEWTAPWAGSLTLTPGTTKPWLRVFRETGGVPSSLLSQNTAGKPLVVPVVKGQKLFWTIDSATETAGGLQFDWKLPPPNDLAANAPLITSFPFSVTGTTLGASRDKQENKKYHSKYFPLESIWWKLTPPRDMVLDFSVRDDKGTAYLLPTKGKAPTFPKNYEFLNSASVPQQLKAGKSYLLLVVPSRPAASGEITVSGWAPDQVKITRQPEELAVSLGERASLTLDAVGGDLSWGVEWFKDGRSLGLGGPWLNPVTEDSLGSYHAVVKNTGSGASETTRTVKVIPRVEKPRLAAHEPVRRLIEGQTLQLSARFSNFGAISYEWRKDGVKLQGADGPQLSVEEVTMEDAGSYTVTATNSSGSSQAAFTVRIAQAPWKGWTEHTPRSTGRGRILQMSSRGTQVEALTANEWLRSADAGLTWTPVSLPARFTASSGASLPDGTLMVKGSSYDGLYGDEATWHRAPGGTWQKLEPRTKRVDGSTTRLRVEHIFTLGAKLYVVGLAGEGEIHSGNLYRGAFESADGLNWTAIRNPAKPAEPLVLEKAIRFSGTLALVHWRDSSNRNALLLKDNGQQELIELASPNELLQLDGSFVSAFSSYSIGIGEFRTEADGMLRGLSAGSVMAGFGKENLRGKALNFTSYARSNGRWVLGYEDGSLWSGVDLFEAPIGKTGLGASKLVALGNEFIAGEWQSSDGARWQRVGPMSGEVMARAGDQLLLNHFDSSTPYSANAILGTFSPGVNPVPVEGWLPAGGLEGYFWSGPDAVFRNHEHGPGRITQILRPSPSGIRAENIDLGADWDFVTDVKQVGSRWFIRGTEGHQSRPFLSTSPDGRTWSKQALLDGSLAGGKEGRFLAVRSAGRAFFSPDGASWKPVVLRGLPAVPTNVVSYRDCLLAHCGRDLYVSFEGQEWFLASGNLPFDRIVENRHTVLAVSGGRFLLPDSETQRGPRITLPESLRKVSTPIHQPFTFEVQADGEVQELRCLVNGVLHSTLPAAPNAAPYRFSFDAARSETLGLEFQARDASGRIARTTATLEVMALGVTDGISGVASTSPDTVRFKGKYYTWDFRFSSESSLYSSVDGETWSVVGLPSFNGTGFAANDQAMVITGSTGIMVSRDGVSWVILSGFGMVNNVLPQVMLEGNTFYLKDDRGTYSSVDGLAWTPVEGSRHEPGTVISGSARFLHGLVSYDEGRNWVLPQGELLEQQAVIPVNGGFLIQARDEVYGPHRVKLLKNGEYRFSDIWVPQGENPPVFLFPLEGKAFFGEHTKSLFSTWDGVTIDTHTPPPNKYRSTFVRHGGEWLAISNDMIAASPDLENWRRLVNFADYAGGWSISDYADFQVSAYGEDSLVVSDLSVGLDRRRFIVGPDLSITESPLRFATWDPPLETSPERPGVGYGGARLGDRVITVGGWVHSKPAGAQGGWKRATLETVPGFVPPHENYRPETKTSALNAATGNRFLMLIKAYDRRFEKDLVYYSTDSEKVLIDFWNAPVTLDEVTVLAASADTFLAGVNGGKVLKSSQGITWSLHEVSPGFVIEQLFHAHGRWHAAGIYPGAVVNGTWTPPAAAVFQSVDGVSWQKSWENRTTTVSYLHITGAFSAHGRTWIHHGSLGWHKTTDGLTWTRDEAAMAPTHRNSTFDAKGSHPEGILAMHSSKPGHIFIVNPDTWQPIRTVNLKGVEIHWNHQWPYLKSPGRLTEWTESDPRIVSLAAEQISPAVGDQVAVDIKVAELPAAGAPVRVFLSSDGILGHPANRTLGTIPWEQGVARPDGSRRFTVTLPPSVDPGSFRLGAALELGSQAADLGSQNNLRATSAPNVQITGYQFQLTQTGPGSVTRNDPRGYLPRGFPVQLVAVDGNFKHWKQGANLQTARTLSFPLLGDTAVEAVFSAGVLQGLRDAAFASAPAGTDRSWSGDPDGDGVSTWHEVLLGSSPLQAGGNPLALQKDAAGIKLTYRRLAGTPLASNVAPQFSESLATWSGTPPFEVSERVTGLDGEIETVELTIPIRSGRGAFVRLNLPPAPAEN